VINQWRIPRQPPAQNHQHHPQCMDQPTVPHPSTAFFHPIFGTSVSLTCEGVNAGGR